MFQQYVQPQAKSATQTKDATNKSGISETHGLSNSPRSTASASKPNITPLSPLVNGPPLETWQSPVPTVPFGLYAESQYVQTPAKQHFAQASQPYHQPTYMFNNGAQSHMTGVGFNTANQQQHQQFTHFINPQQAYLVGQSVAPAGIAYHYGTANQNGTQLPTNNRVQPPSTQPNTIQATQVTYKPSASAVQTNRHTAEGGKSLEQVNRLMRMSLSEEKTKTKAHAGKTEKQFDPQPSLGPSGVVKDFLTASIPGNTKRTYIQPKDMNANKSDELGQSEIKQNAVLSQNQLQTAKGDNWSPHTQNIEPDNTSVNVCVTSPESPTANNGTLPLSKGECAKNATILLDIPTEQAKAKNDLKETNIDQVTNQKPESTKACTSVGFPAEFHSTNMNIMPSDSEMSLADNTKMRSPPNSIQPPENITPQKPPQATNHTVAVNLRDCAHLTTSQNRENINQSTPKLSDPVVQLNQQECGAGYLGKDMDVIKGKNSANSPQQQSSESLDNVTQQSQLAKDMAKSRKVGLPPRVVNQRVKIRPPLAYHTPLPKWTP